MAVPTGATRGFIRRLREGEGHWFGHVLEHVSESKSNVYAGQSTFGKTRSVDAPGGLRMVFEYEEATGVGT